MWWKGQKQKAEEKESFVESEMKTAQKDEKSLSSKEFWGTGREFWALISHFGLFSNLSIHNFHYTFFPSFVDTDKETDIKNKELTEIHTNLKYKITSNEFFARRIAFSSWCSYTSSNHAVHKFIQFVFE
jgi:hypothetical protein